MKISAKGEYAYRAVYELALKSLKSQDGVVQLEEIAARQSIPRKYLVQILLQLKRAGLVGTLRGVQGGYYLRRPPSQITLGEVLELIDGPFIPVSRTTERGDAAQDELARVITPIFEEVRGAVREIVCKVTFEDLCHRTEEPREQMYYI